MGKDTLEREKQAARATGARAKEKLTEAGGPLGRVMRPIGETIAAQTAQEKITKAGERARGISTRMRELPTTPPTPEWLAPLAPWLTAGQPITRGQMPTPSGQQWQTLSPSTLAGLRGFTQWKGAGRSFADIQAEMQQMQPEAPWGGRGRWRTARQV